jgi:hypothetical protein
MIEYRKFIEDNFLIDAAKNGQLVPFIFNDVQNEYYNDLVRKYDIERKGIDVPIRENILKARREGFSSMILGIFAADDLTQENPTETDVLSYKDDATNTFRNRYRTYILSFYLKLAGYTPEQIRENPRLLEDIAPQVFSVDSTDLQLKVNKAHFQCNTASARVGGRGGVRHKILFSEIAFYPDTPKLKASEMVEATSQQVDPDSGWIFCESTENGIGTYQYRMWENAKKGLLRYCNRFYGAMKHYTDERIATIKQGYVDMDAFRRDYPMTEDDLFKGGTKSFTTEDSLMAMVGIGAHKEIAFKMDLSGENYIDQAETIKTQLEMLSKSNRGHALYAGLDTAKITDRTTLLVLRDTRVDLNGGGVKALAIDTTNGDFMADWFERNTNFYVVKVKFSRPSKSLMYTNLQIVIKQKLTCLPLPKDQEGQWVSDEEARFWAQMLSLEKELKGNLLVVAHPEGSCKASDHDYDDCAYHDDYPDSWMLAEHAYFDINGVPKVLAKPEVPTVPNAIENLLQKAQKAGSTYRTGGYE